MTVAKIHFTCLDVGQGLSTFVELFDQDRDDADPTHTILLDLGSRGDREAGKSSADWISERLKRMAQPTIDAMFLSHEDEDHHNLIGRVLDDYTPFIPGEQEGPDTLLIRYVLYGGVYKKYRRKKVSKTNILSRLDRFMRKNDDDDPVETYDETTAAPSAMCSFEGDDTEACYTIADTVKAYVLTGNLATGSRRVVGGKSSRDAYEINSDSLVVVLGAMGTQFLSTGDATGVSMYVSSRNLREQAPEHLVDNIFGTTAPHHGSAGTAFEVKMLKPPNQTAREVVEEFVKLVNTKSLVASASFSNNFKHPSADLLSYFWVKLPHNEEPTWNDDELNEHHYYTAFFGKRLYEREDENEKTKQTIVSSWPKRSNMFSIQTQDPLFTTAYRIGRFDRSDAVIPPNPIVTWNETDKAVRQRQMRGVSWRYELRQKNGKPDMKMFADRVRTAVRDRSAGLPPSGDEPQDAAGPAVPVAPVFAPGPRRRPAGVPGGAGSRGLSGLRELL